MMSELEKLDDLIAGYIGKAKRFKKGIVYDENPEFGDMVRITAIVTGFKFDLSGFDKENLDNIVIIDNDFEWETPEKQEGPIVNAEPPIRIGPRQTRKKFDHIEEKPALCVEPGERTAELEHIPAVRRIASTGGVC